MLNWSIRHIARIYDAGVSDDGQPFLAMEYVDGLPIDEYADAARLTVPQRLRLFLQVLDAVAYAHQRLVLHRDLKPGNVLVSTNGETRLLDFGIARLLPEAVLPLADVPGQAATAAQTVVHEISDLGLVDDGGLTGHAGRVYTLAYAAPEQVDGAPLSTATDVYALGVMLFHLLTGLSPYQPTGASRAALVDVVCRVQP